MQHQTHLRFERRPSTAGLFLTILRNSRSRTRDPARSLGLCASWEDIRIERQHAEAFHAACGLPGEEGLSILYPMSIAYPLILRLLSHRNAPMPLFHALNTRMLLQQYQPLSMEDRPDLHAGVTAMRHTEKGLELDVYGHIDVRGTRIWECFMTFFYRGRAKGSDKPAAGETELRVDNADCLIDWHLPAEGRMRFGQLCGDANPIHYARHYARVFGFERDFAQPLLVIGQGLAHLPGLPKSDRQRMEARLKGPVYYEHDLTMTVKKLATGAGFDIYCGANPKPGICARIETLP